MIKRLLPSITEYVLLESNLQNFQTEIIPNPRIHVIDPNLLERLEMSRPGYRMTAMRYLEDGHTGYAYFIDKDIAATAWVYANTSDRTAKVKGYFPLPADCALFHADWTHPEYRGRGLHQILIRHRLHEIKLESAITRAMTNISEFNILSINNYKKTGFNISGQLITTRWLKLSRGRILINGH